MKIVIQEWLKDKKATAQIIAYFMCCFIWYVLDAYLIIRIGEVLSIGDIKNGVINIAVLLLAMSLTELLEDWFRKVGTFHCFRSMHNRFGDKILDADYSMFTYFSVAKITTIGEFMGSITHIFKSMLQMMMNGVNIIIILGSMWYLGGAMIVPVILLYIVYAMISRVIYRKYAKHDKKMKKLVKARNQEFENIINGFQEIRSFSMIDYEKSKLHKMNDDVHKVFMGKAYLNIKFTSAIEVIDSLAYLFVIAYSLYQIANGHLTAASAMSLIMFVMKIMSPLIMILDWIEELSDQLKMADDYSELINWVNRVKKGHITMDSFNHEITLKDVRFAYENSSSVLNGININIKKGQHIGICGKTGDGKSTLLKLLNKFYDVESGEILIDGINLSDITASSYRQHVGSVHQENFIFPGSIMENVMYGSPNATEYEVVEACKKAKLYDFVRSLKDGFNTDVGPKGLKLSGGQKQRIALARLFLQDPEIIILDEATSALDNETEMFIQDAISALQGKTIITVAHRLTTIQNCDEIYVLNGGRIAEHGSHNDLMNIKGIYYSMQNVKG